MIDFHWDNFLERFSYHPPNKTITALFEQQLVTDRFSYNRFFERDICFFEGRFFERDFFPKDVSPKDVSPRDVCSKDISPKDVSSEEVSLKEVFLRKKLPLICILISMTGLCKKLLKKLPYFESKNTSIRYTVRGVLFYSSNLFFALLTV